MRQMELLAPAGSWESFLAAVNNGADAVYIGGQQFSARQAAANFDLHKIEEAIRYGHQRGRKIYVTVNTLIGAQEFDAVLDYLWQLTNCGVDAVILQDVGLLEAARNLLPGLRIHASTQMTTHNQDGAAFLQRLGVSRIVLARELAAEEIKMIHQAVPEIQLEVFVHGALCYSYSGQCLFSSMIGGRSGNRGRCAQPCRLPYGIYRDKQPIVQEGRGRYLLSPADLCLIQYLPVIAALGVTAVKIEGRMRRPEYVAVVTRAYRQVLDTLQDEPGHEVDPEIMERLLAIFNRGFTTGHVIKDQKSPMSKVSPKNRGVQVGHVLEQSRSYDTKIELDGMVQLGDGLAVWAGAGRIRPVLLREIRVDGQRVAEAHAGQIITVKLDGPVFPSNPVFKTHDQELINHARRTIAAQPPPRIAVEAEVILTPGEKLHLFLQAQGRRVQADSRHELQPAHTQPLDNAVLREKIGRMGNSPFLLKDLTVTGTTNLTLPLSDLNEVRRRAVDLLSQEFWPGETATADREKFKRDKIAFLSTQRTCGAERTQLAVAVSNLEAASRALAGGADLIYLGIDGMGSHQRIDQHGLDRFRLGLGGDGGRIVPMLPRIHKPADDWDYRQVVSDCPAIMVSSWADLDWAGKQAGHIYTDYNMNVFNPYTLRFLAGVGVDRVSLSPELSLKQLAEFRDLSQAELLVHGDIIIMQSQYCLIGQTRSPGLLACSWACRRGDYVLRDDRGYSFPLETDADCHQYIFNSRRLCLMEDLDRILAMHPGTIRIEARRYRSEQLEPLIGLYREALDEIHAGRSPDLKRLQLYLAQLDAVGFTKGHYFRGVL